jgi:hypothetical protein
MDKINGVQLTVLGQNGHVSKPAYEAHSMHKVIEIINATWRIEHVVDITEVEVY